jgi:RNA polymerase sigma-70 factor, ECF subfamily
MSKYEDPLPGAFQAGEEWAFIELDRQYRSRILGFVTRLLGNRESAEDVTQEVLLKAYRFRESYNPCYALWTWVSAIARNTVVDWQRRDRAPMEDSPPSIEDLACPHPDAEAVLWRRLEVKRLFALVKRLSFLQRRVVWLRVVRQMSYQEIAGRLGISLAAAKCAAYRARVVLLPLVGSAAAVL